MSINALESSLAGWGRMRYASALVVAERPNIEAHPDFHVLSTQSVILTIRLTVLLLVERSVTASSTKGVGFGVTFTANFLSVYCDNLAEFRQVIGPLVIRRSLLVVFASFPCLLYVPSVSASCASKEIRHRVS